MENKSITTLQAEKQRAWGNFGVALVNAETNLSLEKSKIVNTLKKLEVSKDNLKEAENLLKLAKSDLKSLIENRKKLTDPIDGVKSRLMENEKATDLEIKNYEQSIIGVKKIIQEEIRKKEAKGDEKKLYISKLNQAYIELNDYLQSVVNKKTMDLYLSILNDEVPFDEYDTAVMGKMLEIKANSNLPTLKAYFEKQNFVNAHHTREELMAIYEENKQNAHSVIDVYAQIETNLKNKKVGYRSELANKEEAKKMALKEQIEADKKRLAEKQNAELEAKIQQAAAEDAKPKSDVKDLKLVYEVEMENTPQTALQLFATFSANYDLVLSKLKVNQWMAFTPKQIASVLGRLKTENNSLEFTGITFKEVDKL